ncbi:MAG: YesL family protein [Lachnospiraceae bacterium]|nr:YesL family protein [Lachnospiraceae bacterium]
MNVENVNVTETEEKEKTGGHTPGFFDIDHPFNRFMNRAGTFIVANLLFLLCSVPIVTIGASLSALNAVMYEYRKHEDVKVFSTFFGAFKENFLKACVGWIIGAALLSIGVVGILMTLKATSLVTMFLGFAGFGCLTFISLCFLTFYFGLIAKYDNDIVSQLKNGVLLGVTYVRWGVLIWLLWIIPLGLFYLFWDVLMYVGFVWPMFGFSVLVNITVMIYNRVFMLVKSREITDEY